MGYLKIIFYGLLAFVERHPIFTLALVAVGVFAPALFKVAGWIILGILLAIVVLVAIGSLRLRRMRQQMEEQMRQSGFSAGGFSGMGGFGNMGGAANGMTLEELVRRMQAEADARRQGTASSNTTTTTSSSKSEKRVNDKVGDYVDFEEVE